MNEKPITGAPPPVKDHATYTWYLEANEYHGHLWLSWSTTAPFRAQNGMIAVYDSQSFPSDPSNGILQWQWDNVDSGGWDTGLKSGSNWCCAWIAEKPPNGPYAYVVTLVTIGN